MPARALSRLVARLFARPQSRRDRRRSSPLGRDLPLEDRTVPAVSFTVEALANTAEGGAAAAFRVTATGDPSDFTPYPVYAIWSATGGTATYNTDFTLDIASGSYLTFPSSGSQVTVTVTPTDDGVYEGDETVEFKVQRYQMMPTGVWTAGTMTLADNEPKPVVSVVAVDDAVEGGATGTFRFTRTGDTSTNLTVTYVVQTVGPGLATPGDDYTALSGSVTILAGNASADVTVSPLVDNLAEYDEAVAINVSTSSAYDLGTAAAATLYVYDDPDTARTLIHQETFTLTGTAGSVSVTLDVTYNADEPDGLYTWTYTVTNPSEEDTDWTDFTIPIEGMDDDVGDLQNDLGWTGTIGSSGVSWNAGGGMVLAPGQVGTFSFTTAPRLVEPATVSVSATGAVAQQPNAPAPGQPAPAPRAIVSFLGGANSTHNYHLRLQITTATGNPVSIDAFTINVNGPGDARDVVYNWLVDNGIRVNRVNNNTLDIRGVALPNNRTNAIRTINIDFQSAGQNNQGSIGVTGMGASATLTIRQ